MKKALFLGLMAFIVSIASAANVSWSNMTSNGKLSYINFDKSSMDNGKRRGEISFTLGTTTAIQTGDILSSIVLAKAVSDYSFITAKGSDYIKITASDGKTYLSNKLSEGNNDITVVGGSESLTRSSLTYTFATDIILDTSVTYTIEFYSDAACTKYTPAYLMVTDEMNDITSNDKFPETLEACITINATNDSVVPEPTVLALLALGVAGLALKRRI